MKGFLVAAPHSSSGKTVVTMGLIRALERSGTPVAPAKAGPDFIDPRFLSIAGSQAAINLDPWAMRQDLIAAMCARQIQGGRLMVVEGMMGLFDAAQDGKGSTADLAALLTLPVILVIDCARMSQSVAALVRGFRDHRNDVDVAGVILNRVGGERHETMLRDALAAMRTPVLGVIHRDEALELPSRHLGLVQADEHPEINAFCDKAADLVAARVDIPQLLRIASRFPQFVAPAAVPRLKAPGRRLSIARDEAFGFGYEHLILGWQRQRAQVSFFSPLADEAPDPDADAVLLPGGYPELHAARLAGNGRFLDGVRAAAARGAVVYGECGGYMALGQAIIDADGQRHAMLGLLPLVTSFAQRRMVLGYRRVAFCKGLHFSGRFNGHEFHHATIVEQGDAAALFDVEDTMGTSLGKHGMVDRNVFGSFIHLIDVADAVDDMMFSSFDEDDA